MAKLLTTPAELRAAFPKASPWWIKLQLALLREGSVVIGSRIPRTGFEAAVEEKLYPTGQRVPGHLRKAATLALDDAIKPRRTGKPRGRPKLHLDRIIVSIHECFEGERFFDEQRMYAVVLSALGRRLTITERAAVLADLEVVTDARGRRVDWRAWLKKWRHALNKGGAD